MRFAEAEGRRPRILVARMGQDGHDRRQKVIVTAFADLGFDVDVGPLFSTRKRWAGGGRRRPACGRGKFAGRRALDLVRALKAAMTALGRPEIVVGGVIPPEDIPELHDAGAAAVFGPGPSSRKLLWISSRTCAPRSRSDVGIATVLAGWLFGCSWSLLPGLWTGRRFERSWARTSISSSVPRCAASCSLRHHDPVGRPAM